jgi:hypothetical protein
MQRACVGSSRVCATAAQHNVGKIKGTVELIFVSAVNARKHRGRSSLAPPPPPPPPKYLHQKTESVFRQRHVVVFRRRQKGIYVTKLTRLITVHAVL